MIKLWEALSGLPAIFPDGKRLDEIAYPWLFNGLVRRHFRLLKTDRPFIAHVQEWITIILAWWVVPITMICFWIRYIPRHDWLGSSLQIVLIVLSIVFGLFFFRMSALTLKGKEKHNLSSLKSLSIYIFTILLTWVTFFILSFGAINGEKLQNFTTAKLNGLSFPKQIIPCLFQRFGYDVFADFRGMYVSEKPLNYYEISKDERLESVKGATLGNANLAHANLYGAFLINADLRHANLYSAELSYANLQNSDLSYSNLTKTFQYETKLQHANLLGADLQFSTLTDANMEGANLSEANLRNASLSGNGANLKNADLTFSVLEEANLSYAKLNYANLKYANLKYAILKNANLHQTDCSHTNLYKADFDGANLAGANFYHSFLIMSKNLTIEQLSKVKTLYKANLDPDLMKQVKDCCPHLLEKPKEVTEQSNQ